MPRTMCDNPTCPPIILQTRTLSGDTLLEEDITVKHASAIRGASTASDPYCFAIITGVTTRTSSSFERTSLTLSLHSDGRYSFRVASHAFLNPLIISLPCKPILSNSSVLARSSPAKLTHKFVPSPHSSSCIWDANESILAAGCSISSSFRIVAQSFVTIIFSRWFTTSLFMPLGPRDVATIVESCRDAVMLRKVASLDDCVVVPPLSIDVRGWLGFSDNDIVGFV
mmetsp:Transcript_52936/g.63739  ORF Transcript_52936/g.63739 Transcript_52936/m.63739 type:complete len:226 (+) Transcript_52936:1151-1828(+)